MHPVQHAGHAKIVAPQGFERPERLVLLIGEVASFPSGGILGPDVTTVDLGATSRRIVSSALGISANGAVCAAAPRRRRAAVWRSLGARTSSDTTDSHWRAGWPIRALPRWSSLKRRPSASAMGQRSTRCAHRTGSFGRRNEHSLARRCGHTPTKIDEPGKVDVLKTRPVETGLNCSREAEMHWIDPAPQSSPSVAADSTVTLQRERHHPI